MQIRNGFKLSNSYGSLYFPVDLIELVVEFASVDLLDDEDDGYAFFLSSSSSSSSCE